MKMRKLRHPKYKHTCGCLPDGEFEYIGELPKVKDDCVDPKYWKLAGKTWIDVTDQVPDNPHDYDCYRQ
jgi:hypothetical protein